MCLNPGEDTQASGMKRSPSRAQKQFFHSQKECFLVLSKSLRFNLFVSTVPSLFHLYMISRVRERQVSRYQLSLLLPSQLYSLIFKLGNMFLLS